MKPIILACLVALIGSGLGCTRKSEQLSGFGVIQSPKGSWKIELLEATPGLRIADRSGTANFRMPVAWTNTKDAFVYVDQDERIWAFDGHQQTFIFEKIGKGEYRASSLADWNDPVPTQFNSKLPPPIRR